MDNETSSYNGARPEQGRALVAERTGNTGEVGGESKPQPEGLWRHPQSGAEVITQTDPLLGDGQSRAALRAGFEFVRNVEPGEVKEPGIPSEHFEKQPERQVEAQSNELAELRANQARLEAQLATVLNQQSSGATVPGTEPVQGAETTKQAAADRTELQTGVQVDPSTGDVADEAADRKESSDSEASYKDLQAEAKELGVNAKGSADELKQRIADAKS